jgi:hypothetical protein
MRAFQKSASSRRVKVRPYATPAPASPSMRSSRDVPPMFKGRDRGPELVHQHGYAESDRERRDASPEVTHVERTDLRQRLNASLDIDETRK